MKTRWRIVAGVTLLMYGALAVLITWWLAHNLLLATVLALAALCCMAAGWLIFTGSGKRARRGYVAAACGVMLALAAAVYNVRNAEGRWGIATAVILSLVYLVVLGRLRTHYWMHARNAHRPEGAFIRPFLIINPKSGDGRAIREHIPQRAKDMGIRVLLTKKSDDMEATARRAVADGADVLGVSGGDGSLGAIAKVAIEHGLPIVVLPGGTRCHFARDIGLEPERITDALAGFHGVERRVDVASINGRIVLNNVAFGLYADIIDHPQYRNHKRAVSRQVLRDLLDGKKDAYPLRFRYSNLHFYKAVQILVGVNRYTTMDVFELGHRRRLDEGVLQVTAITRLNDSLAATLVGAMSIGRLRGRNALPDVYQWATPQFQVGAPSSSLIVGVDGECEQYQTPVTITVLPRALRIYVPAEGVRGRRKNPFSLFVARKLWQAASGGR